MARVPATGRGFYVLYACLVRFIYLHCRTTWSTLKEASKQVLLQGVVLCVAVEAALWELNCRLRLQLTTLVQKVGQNSTSDFLFIRLLCMQCIAQLDIAVSMQQYEEDMD